MAAVKTNLSCQICDAVMNIPTQNMDFLDFIVLQIQFYKQHDVCEKSQNIMNKKKEEFEKQQAQAQAKLDKKKKRK